MVIIEVSTKDLVKTLKHLKVAVKGRSKKARNTICEITVTDGKISCAVPGSIFNLQCKTKGVAKITIPFLYFFDIIKNNNEAMTIMKIMDGEVNIGPLTFSANTSFIEDDKILRTIDLPMNYNDMYLLRLPYEGYTKEELDFNKITPMIEDAKTRLFDDIKRAHSILFAYGISFEDLNTFVVQSIKEDTYHQKKSPPTP